MTNETESKKTEEKIEGVEAPQELGDEALDEAQGGLMSLNLNTQINPNTLNIASTNVLNTSSTNTLGGGNLDHYFKLRTRPGRG